MLRGMGRLAHLLGGSLSRAAARLVRGGRRPTSTDDAGPQDLPPDWDAFFAEADALAGVFRRRRRRTALVLLGAAASVALFAAGFAVHLAFFGTESGTGGELSQEEAQRLLDKVLPIEGFTVNARWGDVLPRLVEAGVIDIEKFELYARRAGAPLTQEQLQLLTAPSDEKLRIDRSNTYFMLNALWAVGLANDSAVLSEGPMADLGEEAGRLASTGGWTLGDRPGPEYLASLDLVPLAPQQEQLVLGVASGTYRPCCNNSTALPDCNHGAAALGLAEIMASQGASKEEIFEALKAFNSYWFPESYYRLALFFDEQGTKWEDVSAEMVVGRQYSSQAGAAQVEAQLRSLGRLPQVQGGAGGSCSQ